MQPQKNKNNNNISVYDFEWLRDLTGGGLHEYNSLCVFVVF